jgi:glutamate-ammonia-ligase adenylyltransferase
VRSAFSTLLGQTAREELPSDPRLAIALDLDSAELARKGALREVGFADPDQALAALDRLARIRQSPFGAAPSGPSLQAVRLMSELIRTPDPDQALLLFAEFLAALSAPQSYVDLLTHAPQTGRRLLNLFGQSEYLSRSFLRHPELLDTLVQPSLGDGAGKEPARIRAELGARTQRHDDPEARLTAMRRFKNEEVLRIGLEDIAGALSVPDVARQLTAIAEGVIDESLFLAETEARERWGAPRTERGQETLTVIGMGKLGGQELGYHSDLDLIFLYSGAGSHETTGGTRGRITHHEYFAKIVQRLLTFLQMQLREGLLYKVDTRLRPSGNQGPLVVSEEAFREHHEKRAQLWERQALIKARAIAGDQERFSIIRREVLDPLIYERPLPPGAAAEIDRLRTRMEKELGQESKEALNTKVGHGALVDVEFTVQYLELVHGQSKPEVRSPTTLEALDALEASGCLGAHDASELRAGYLFLRKVENRQRLVHGHSLSLMPTAGRPLALLARRLGYLGSDPGAAFLAEYRHYTDRVRGVYARWLRRDPVSA